MTMRGWQGLLRPLSIYEQNVVIAEVSQKLTELPKPQQNAMMENSLLCIKTLVKASTSDVDKTDFTLTEMELQRLSAVEIEFLHAEYVSACQKLNPRLEMLTKSDVDALVNECKKKGESLDSQLMELSFWQCWNIARQYCLTPDV
jgi:hypothetical protein